MKASSTLLAVFALVSSSGMPSSSANSLAAAYSTCRFAARSDLLPTRSFCTPSEAYLRAKAGGRGARRARRRRERGCTRRGLWRKMVSCGRSHLSISSSQFLTLLYDSSSVTSYTTMIPCAPR
eukprot:scaffold236000_cov20-Tisochrysis_lutea.AAC.2